MEYKSFTPGSFAATKLHDGARADELLPLADWVFLPKDLLPKFLIACYQEVNFGEVLRKLGLVDEISSAKIPTTQNSREPNHDETVSMTDYSDDGDRNVKIRSAFEEDIGSDLNRPPTPTTPKKKIQNKFRMCLETGLDDTFMDMFSKKPSFFSPRNTNGSTYKFCQNSKIAWDPTTSGNISALIEVTHSSQHCFREFFRQRLGNGILFISQIYPVEVPPTSSLLPRPFLREFGRLAAHIKYGHHHLVAANNLFSGSWDEWPVGAYGYLIRRNSNNSQTVNVDFALQLWRDCVTAVQPLSLHIDDNYTVDATLLEEAIKLSALTMVVDLRRNFVLLPTLSDALPIELLTLPGKVEVTFQIKEVLFGITLPLGQEFRVTESRKFEYKSILIWFSSPDCVQGVSAMNGVEEHEVLEIRPTHLEQYQKGQVTRIDATSSLLIEVNRDDDIFGNDSITCSPMPIPIGQIEKLSNATRKNGTSPLSDHNINLNLPRRRPVWLWHSLVGFYFGMITSLWFCGTVFYIVRDNLYDAYFEAVYFEEAVEIVKRRQERKKMSKKKSESLLLPATEVASSNVTRSLQTEGDKFSFAETTVTEVENQETQEEIMYTMATLLRQMKNRNMQDPLTVTEGSAEFVTVNDETEEKTHQLSKKSKKSRKERKEKLNDSRKSSKKGRKAKLKKCASKPSVNRAGLRPLQCLNSPEPLAPPTTDGVPSTDNIKTTPH